MKVYGLQVAYPDFVKWHGVIYKNKATAEKEAEEIKYLLRDKQIIVFVEEYEINEE